MPRFLNYVILLGDEDDFARIDELEDEEGRTVVNARNAIHANHQPLFLPRNIDSTSLILYKSRQNLPVELEDALLERIKEVEKEGEIQRLMPGRIRDALGTDQLDPSLVHLVVKVRGPGLALEELGDQDIPHREQVTFKIRFSGSGNKPDWLSACNSLDLKFIDTPILSDEVAARVDALRRILGRKRAAPEGSEDVTDHLLKCFRINNAYEEIVGKLLSREAGAKPYAYWFLEIVHYVLALAHVLARNMDSVGVDAFALQSTRSIVYDRFLAFWLIKIKGRCTLGQNFPFPLIAEVYDGGEHLKYLPQPDIAFLKGNLPRFLAEVDSHSDQQDKFRLLVEMTCVLRLACALGAEKDKFFLMGVFFGKDRIIYRYILFYGGEEIQCLGDQFRMDNADRLITFLFEFYNYAKYVGEDETSYGDKSIEKMSHAIRKGIDKSLYTKRQSNKHGRSEEDQGGTDRAPRRPAPGASNRAALTDVLQKSGYVVQKVYPKGFEPLDELPDNIMKATAGNGKAVIAKLCRRNSIEAHLLRELLTHESPHNHVIPLLDVVQSSLGPVIILPLATSLSPEKTSDLFRKELRGEFVRLGHELVEGVAFLHRHKIAHLDIKPDNLVYSFEFERLYIIDFDIAMQCKGADEMVMMSCGTAGWSAPEIVHDENEPLRAFSPMRADLWSCGKTLRHFAEASKDEDSDLMQLIDFLLDDDPRRRPLLHEIVEEEPDFWTSRCLPQALNGHECGDKVRETTVESGARPKRARNDADYVDEEDLAPKVLRVIGALASRSATLASSPSQFPRQ